MKFIFATLMLGTAFSYTYGKVDKRQTLNGVKLRSSKEDVVRKYNGRMERTYPYPISVIKSGITNFTERCNNSFRSRRKFTALETDCKFHHDSIVETFVIKDFKGHEESYLLGRKVYNRTEYNRYELVTIHEGQDEEARKTITITSKMLSDEAVKEFTAPPFVTDSEFKDSVTTFTLTAISPQQTKITFDYNSETDHWLLNKVISVPQVFSFISRDMLDTMNSLEKEASKQLREIASGKK
jgi:prolyl oligopeptidase PreP (S9A serine peptidase family)